MSSRVFSTNVLSSEGYLKMNEESIQMVIVNDRVIEFSLNSNVNKLAALPLGFFWKIQDNGLHVLRQKVAVKNFEKVFYHKITGTYRSLIINAIKGLLTNYIKRILIVGSGYRSSYDIINHSLHITVGYANIVVYKLKKTVIAKLESNGTEIILSSHNREDVSQDVSRIKKIKKPNVYNGSGIHDADKVFVRKEVKKT